MTWLLLAYQIPSEPSARRVAVWRKLKRLGALLLHDSLWVLPANPHTREQFQWLAGEIIDFGGEATFWEGELLVGGEQANLVGQFREQVEVVYRDILAKLELPDNDLATLARDYQQAKARDYFESELGNVVRDKLIDAREGRSS
ncbi:MAG: Chromate resistance protein ChrB [Chloroflexota bacterium]